ncbi:MAG: FAD:protein FMN transferase [Gaiellaceae bacterium]
MIGAVLVREPFRAMGTECAVAVTAGRAEAARARRALAAGRGEVEACERALSRFDERSDLSRLNRAGGAWVEIDQRLVEALRAAVRTREETGGRFDPTILPALVAAGYDRSFEQLAERPPSRVDGWRAGAAIEVDAGGARARIEAGAAVDLGGIGKGFAATRALWAMRDAWLELPGGLVDLGGDVAVWGEPPKGGAWRIAIADPRSPGAQLGTVEISDGAVATSGRDTRRFGPEGDLHHLIDPATGTSAAGDLLRVTVIGSDAIVAEIWAKALFLAGAKAAEVEANARALPSLLITTDGRTIVAGGLQ